MEVAISKSLVKNEERKKLLGFYIDVNLNLDQHKTSTSLVKESKNNFLEFANA